MINVAVLDACVLYSASLRDFLLQLGYAKLFRPVWTEIIHEEWIQSLLQNRPDLSRERLERTKWTQSFHEVVLWDSRRSS